MSRDWDISHFKKHLHKSTPLGIAVHLFLNKREEMGMSSAKIKLVTDANFDSDVLKSATPVLVDFWAPWCGPCKALAPTVDKIADENEGKLLVCKVNVDDSPDVSARYGIRGIPTLILFKGGEVVNQITGAVPKSSIDALIAQAL
jgi:thioredoxin 1